VSLGGWIALALGLGVLVAVALAIRGYPRDGSF
jgi:hypothetical protein